MAALVEILRPGFILREAKGASRRPVVQQQAAAVS